jgi:hypothetical protein
LKEFPMKRLSFAAALMVLLALAPMTFAQDNGGESGSPSYGESSGEPNPSMEGDEGSGQSQESAEPEQQEPSPDNPSDSGEMQESPSDEGNADQDNTNQGNTDSDNPDSAGSQDSGESAQPRE